MIKSLFITLLFFITFSANATKDIIDDTTPKNLEQNVLHSIYCYDEILVRDAVNSLILKPLQSKYPNLKALLAKDPSYLGSTKTHIYCQVGLLVMETTDRTPEDLSSYSFKFGVDLQTLEKYKHKAEAI